MVPGITVSPSCVKQLAIMGWVSHAAGVLSMAIALATEHWLRRLSNGQHVGIFPCCPTFKCDKKTIPENENSIGAFSDIIIVGLLLVGLGLVLSLTHSCVSWRNDKRPLYGLSYCASGFVTAGGFTLVGAAIDFVMVVPGNMEGALRVECDEFDDIVQTGFSYGLFVTGAVAFILAGILLFLSSCRQSNPSLLTRRRTRPSIVISESNMCLETVSAHLESQGRLSPMLHTFSEDFNNPVYDIEVEEQQNAAVIRRLSHASPRQCDRLSTHASAHQGGRLSPHHQCDRLSLHVSPHQDGRISPHHQRDRLSTHASPHQDGTLSPHHQRDQLSLHVSPHQDGRISPLHQHDRLSPHHFLYYQHDRLSPHHEHDGFRPLTSPPSYESLQEFFLLNMSDDSELSESRETTELQDLHNNSAESAAQLPTYEDVLKTHPPPYKE